MVFEVVEVCFVFLFLKIFDVLRPSKINRGVRVFLEKQKKSVGIRDTTQRVFRIPSNSH